MEECLRSASHHWSHPSLGQSQEPRQWSASYAGSKHTKHIIDYVQIHVLHKYENPDRVVILTSIFFFILFYFLKNSINNRVYHRFCPTFAWVKAAFFTFSWDCRSLKFLDQPSVFVSLAPTPRSSYNDIVVPERK